MIFQALGARRRAMLILVAAMVIHMPAQAALNYSCNDLGAMAVRFQQLKAKGYELEEVLGVVQKASAGNPDKETLLSNLAIDIYIDPAVVTEKQARRLARSRCSR
jgi:hypothetical protein